MQRCRGAEVQRYRDTEIQQIGREAKRCRGTEIQTYRDTEEQRHRQTETQTHRHTYTDQRHRKVHRKIACAYVDMCI
jgi:hypothetical protein